MYERTYGAKYDGSLDVAEIAKLVRKEIKAEIKAGRFPKGLKVSVRIRRFAGGCSLDAEITGVPDGFVIRNPERVKLEAENPNEHYPTCHYPILTEKAEAIEKKIKSIIAAYNHDGSEIQVDYFDVNFYSSTRWDYDLVNEDKARTLAKLNGEPEPEPKKKEKPEPSVTDKEVEELLEGLRKEPDTTFAVGELSRSRAKIAGWTGKVRSLVHKGILEVVEGRQAWNGSKLYRLTRTPEKKAADDAKLARARELGRAGFEKGIKAPAQDPELTELLEGNKVGEGIPVLDAWNKGWNAALRESWKKQEEAEEKAKAKPKPVPVDLSGPSFPAIKYGVC